MTKEKAPELSLEAKAVSEAGEVRREKEKQDRYQATFRPGLREMKLTKSGNFRTNSSVFAMEPITIFV